MSCGLFSEVVWCVFFSCSGMFLLALSAYEHNMWLKCARVYTPDLQNTPHGPAQLRKQHIAGSCLLQLEGAKHTRSLVPCGSPAPVWSPSQLRACTCSSSASSAWFSPPCPDLSTEMGDCQLGDKALMEAGWRDEVP